MPADPAAPRPTVHEPESARELVVSRIFDAPRELVFNTFTDPEHVSHWWGPRGFTTQTHERDFRPGGLWRHTMVGPDGTHYPNVTKYLEIDPPARLVYTNSGKSEHGPDAQFTTTVTFESVGGKTRLTMRSVFPTIASRDLVIREYKADEGGRQMLERFAELLAASR